MDIFKPFSQEIMNEIFRISPQNPNRIISRENSWLEFKESFGWKSLPRYLKTSASFANTRGGYIVFGVENSPHNLLGLIGSNLQAFENIDPERMTQGFNDHFSPEIEWSIELYELGGKQYGLLYIQEAKEKPVICCKDYKTDLKEGDIYYRYRGRTERIKYPELRAIIENNRESEQRIWMNHLSNISRIGVREAGILDIKSGLVTGKGGSFLIDESLLSHLSFIKEGEFNEVKGKPALRLIGSIETIEAIPSSLGKKQIIKSKGIRIGDIILSFLNLISVPDPKEYIIQICFENTAYLPVYYYIYQSNLTLDETIFQLENVVSRSQSRKKLIERLNNNSTQYLGPLTGDTTKINMQREYLERIISHSIDLTLSGKNLDYCLQAILHLSKTEISSHNEYIRGLLRTWFNQHFVSADGSMAISLKKAICWVDEALYSNIEP